MTHSLTIASLPFLLDILGRDSFKFQIVKIAKHPLQSWDDTIDSMMMMIIVISNSMDDNFALKNGHFNSPQSFSGKHVSFQ